MKGVQMPINMTVALIVLLLIAIISVLVLAMIYGISNPLLDMLRSVAGG